MKNINKEKHSQNKKRKNKEYVQVCAGGQGLPKGEMQPQVH